MAMLHVLLLAQLCALAARASCAPAVDGGLVVGPLFVANGNEVAVSWSVAPEAGDWVGQYNPPDAPWNAAFDAFPVNASTPLPIRVRVFNVGGEFEFRYYRNGTAGAGESPAPQLIASSSRVRFDPDEIMQVRLAATEFGPSAMRLSWNTRRNATHCVTYARVDGNGPRETARAGMVTYAASDLCMVDNSSTGYRDPGFIHTALLEGLDAGAEYAYEIAACEGGVNGRRGRFRAPPPLGSDVTFIALADMGTDYRPIYWENPGAAQTVRMVVEDPEAAFVLFPGDLAYGVGHAHLWDYWDTLVEAYADRIPNMVGVGNHEYDWPNASVPVWEVHGTDSHGECGVPMARRYAMPRNGNGNLWYSFDFGCVHVAMISTEHDVRAGSVQYAWLDADLAAVDRARTPWVVVSGHRPLH
eukprot:Opistho-1_new@96667